MSQPIELTRAAARRFLVRAHALDGFQTLPDVATALNRLGSVQEDSINISGRIHDLILWARVDQYSPAALHQALYQSPRRAFEYHFPNLHALPLGDYPYFLRTMRRRAEAPGRWQGLETHEEPIAQRILAHMDAHGPLRTRATGSDEGHTISGWGTKQTVASHVVEKMWRYGQLTIARRENFERWFDRTERLLPTAADLALPDEDDEKIFFARKRKRAQKLFRLRNGDQQLLGESAFVRVQIEGVKRLYYALAEDTDALHTAQTADGNGAPVVHLLAPLDPLVYDRARTLEVFGFPYTWEVYTPAAKRQWGYYVLPILFGDRLVGRVDPKLNRQTGTLHLVSLRLEAGVDEGEVGPALMARLADFARFLGATRVSWDTIEPVSLLTQLTQHF